MLCFLPALLLGPCLVGALLAGVGAQTIHQWPPAKVRPVGRALSLEHSVKGTSSPNLFWYQQAAGGALQLLFYCISVYQAESQMPQNLAPSRPQFRLFILSSEKLLLNDSGLYLCAWSIAQPWAGQTSAQKPHCPHSGTRCRVFDTEFFTLSQCESN